MGKSAVALVIAVLAGVLAIFAIWANQQLLDTGSWSSVSRELLKSKEVRHRVAAFLGENPVEHLLGPHVLHNLPHAQAAALTGRSFFPQLMTGPFADALGAAFTFAAIACAVAAAASWLRGGKYHYSDADEPAPPRPRQARPTTSPVHR